MKTKNLIAILACICLIAAGCGSTDTQSANEAKGNANSAQTTDSSETDKDKVSATATPTAAPTGTSSESKTTETPTATATPIADQSAVPTANPTSEPVTAKDASDDAKTIKESFSISTEDGKFTTSGKTYTITTAGTYTLSGLLEEGCIIVDAGDEDKVNLDLNGVKITNSSTAPIVALNADKLKIKSIEDTYNEIVDSRAAKTDDDDGDENAAIFADCDLDLTGKGSLVVSSTYNNGIQSKDSIDIKNVTLKITAANNALRGNDSVDITSGDLILIAKGGDGIKTSNSDISSKGNQRGTVTISGGNVDIYACCDGINAAYDIIISTEGNLNIYTDKYSSYASGKVTSGKDFYLVIPTSVYMSTTDFYGYFYNDDYDAGIWVKSTYDSMISYGRRRYYAMKLSAPTDYANVQFFRVKSGSEPSTSSYSGITQGGLLNTSKNAFMITAYDTSTYVMSGDYTSIVASSGSGNSSKSLYSTKGLSAANAITISNGVISISCSDDGIHAKNDELLETNVYGVGDITIESGTITITAADDGIHADNIVNVNGGEINIITSYEGVEGNVINFNGGNSFVYATDDGLNACAGSVTPMINFNGGYVDVTTPSGDTDAVDSNGSVTMTGGTALIKGGNSSGQMAGSVDVDGSITVSGGTIIALGGICAVPSNSVNGYVAVSTTFESGNYSLKDASGNTIVSFSLSKSYSNGWISSDKLVTGTAYTLYKGDSSVLSWTQTEGTMNASSVKGGMGGHRGGFR